MPDIAKERSRVHLLGIRHHGPGSARGVVAALNAADPAIVLIEGPPDADAMIPFASSPAMVPPLALLVHAEAEPANSSFYPFAEFSPEWQAMRWALARQRPVRFIDLPMTHQLAERAAAKEALEKAAAAGSTDTEPELTPETEADHAGEPTPDRLELMAMRRDPLAYLAQLAGYDDSEAWWNALVEQGAHGPEIFAAIEAAMTALRDKVDAMGHVTADEKRHEDRREAHMRLELGEVLGQTEGPIAVVCGAWHVPALRRKVSVKDDRALLKGLPKIKVACTWVPWTETRLASGSGYGAGVSSPGWYAHLWAELQRPAADAGPLAATTFTSRWQARVATLLRKGGRPTSTASVIEASRLAVTLASLRDLALPGLEEMREASLATLCEGEAASFKLIEAQLIIGQRVGSIDESVPQMPLAADLARWQKKLKLKPEALDADVSLDLRSEAGLAKSLLLHRLNLIAVPWGRMTGAGSSRGTFRENWRLRWEPEFSVRLAEALVYGTTVELAAGNRAVSEARKASTLAAVSDLVRGCLEAGLEAAAKEAIAILQAQAAQSSDITNLASAIPPLAEIMRYGTARDMPVDALRLLVVSLTEAVSAGLVYACRNLQSEAAGVLRDTLSKLDVAVGLIEDAALTAGWHRALGHVAADGSAHPLLRGLAVRALYDHGVADVDATAMFLSRALSPSVPPLDAGGWIDGFLGKSGQILLHDVALRRIIDGWIVTLGDDDFTNLLPVLRRGFSSFDLSERRRLLDEIAKSRAGVVAVPTQVTPQVAGDAPGFAAALPLLLQILGVTRSPSNQDAAPESAA
jgi:Family of unknown function (DUF5682)